MSLIRTIGSLVNNIFKPASVQYPLPIDGDSVYVKDLDIDNCTADGFIFDIGTGTESEVIEDMLKSVFAGKSNASSDNPKTIYLQFNRPVLTSSFGINSAPGKTFSNTKIVLGQGEFTWTAYDDSGDSPTHDIFLFPIEPVKFSSMEITFHTANEIGIGLIGIFKNIEVAARIQALKPDGTVTNVDATAGGNLKMSIEEFESGVSSNSNSQLNVTLFGSDGIEYKQDEITGAFTTVANAHQEIHEGRHFYLQGFLELDDTDEFFMKMVTPDALRWSHFIFAIKSTGICTTYLDEEATGGMAGGSSVIPLNNNRNSATASGMVFTVGVTDATSYTTRLENDKWGAAGFKETIGGGGGREDELMLKQNTTYLRSFISGADSNIIQFKASWYEHINF